MRSTSTTSTRTFQTPPAQVEVSSPKQKRPRSRPQLSKKQLPWIIIAILVILGLLLLSAYMSARQKLDSSGPAYNARMISKLQKVLILPAEQPTIATVKNAAKIDSLAFYKDAQNGDVLFVYSAEHEAILYRPAQNLIVNFSTDINVSGSSSIGQ